MKYFQSKLRDILQTVSRKQFCSITGVPASSLSIWLTSDVEPSDERKRSILESLGLRQDFFRMNPVMKLEEVSTISMTVATAAKLLGCSIEFLHAGLQQNRFPWGYAVERDGHWSYWINGPKLKSLEGIQ